MILSSQDKNLLRQLAFSPQWKALERLIGLMIEEIEERPKLADTEWESIKNLVKAEGEKISLKRLLKEALDHAQNVEE